MNINNKSNSNMETRSSLYRKAKELASALGYDLQPLKLAWKRGTKLYWKQQVEKFENDKQQKNRNTGRFNVIKDELADKQKLNKSYKRINKYKDGAKNNEYVHQIPESLRLRVSSKNLKAIKQQISKVVNKHKKQIGNNRYKIIVKDTRDNRTISTAYHLGDDPLKRLMTDQIGPKAREYQFDRTIEIGEIIINIFKPPRDVMGASSSRIIEQANNKWFIVNPTSIINCVFQSIAVCRNFNTNRKLLGNDKKASECRINSGKLLKYKVKPLNDNYADNMTIQEICNWTRSVVSVVSVASAANIAS